MPTITVFKISLRQLRMKIIPNFPPERPLMWDQRRRSNRNSPLLKKAKRRLRRMANLLLPPHLPMMKLRLRNPLPRKQKAKRSLPKRV